MATEKDDDQDRYWTLSTASGRGSKPPGPPTTTSPARRDRDRSNWIRKCAQLVLSSYRRDDFADPDTYAIQLAMILERYDDKVIDAVTSPATGIQRTCKWPPSIAEMVEFIDEHIRRAGFAANYDARSRAQIEEREQFERDQREPLEYRRAVVERVMADYKSKIVPDIRAAIGKGWQKLTADELLAKYPPKAAP